MWRDPDLRRSNHRKKIEDVVQDIGFIELKHHDATTIVTWILPDVIFLIAMILSYNADVNESRVSRTHSNITSAEFNEMMDRILTFLCLTCICFAAITRPSLITAVYFIVFISTITWIATVTREKKKFNVIFLTTAMILSMHILFILLFHSPWNFILAENEFLIRMLGLTKLITIQPDLSIKVETNLDFDEFLQLPILIIAQYTVLKVGLRLMRNHRRAARQRNEQQFELQAIGRMSFLESIMNTTRRFSQVFKGPDVTIKENRLALMRIMRKFLMTAYIQNIHILTNICMMTYSIIFHSWFGFVFLILSQVFWLIADQRRYMLKTSPLIVAYAIFLLCVEFFAGMEWKVDDFSAKFSTINFSNDQLGIDFVQRYPCLSLMSRILLSLQFWITMRTKFYEERNEHVDQKYKIAQMMKNLREGEGYSPALKTLWRIVSNFVVYSWMWFILLTMLVMSLQSEEMTSPKVESMACCLVFLLTFIISLPLWIRFNYAFWFVMIVKTMCYLVGTYVYQFEQWDGLFGVEKLLGLQNYGKTELFLYFSSLTVIIIMTGIQINFFHGVLMGYMRSTEDQPPPNDRWSIGMERFFDIVEIFFNAIFALAVFQVSIKSINTFTVIILGVLIVMVQSKNQTFKSLTRQLLAVMFACYIESSLLFRYQKEKDLGWLQSSCGDNSTMRSCLIRCEDISTAIQYTNCHFHDWLEFQGVQNGKFISYLILIVFVAFRFAIKYHRKFDKTPSSFKITIESSFDYYTRLFGKEIVSSLIFFLIIYRQDTVSLGYTIMLMVISLKNKETTVTWKLSKQIIQMILFLEITFMLVYVDLKVCDKYEAPENYLEILLNFLIDNPVEFVTKPSCLLIEYMLLMLMTKLSKQPESANQEHIKFLHCKSEMLKKWLELIKTYFMEFHLWTTLILIFMISNSSIDIYTIGYITFVFKFLWQGSDLYLKPTVVIVKEWNFLKVFNMTVFAFKFFMHVLDSYSTKFQIFKHLIFTVHSTNFMRDFWIFNLIMFQSKLFRSKYFLNVVAETFITTNLLSSRGAEMFEELRLKEARININMDKKSLAKFHRKMEKIKEENKKDFALQEQDPTTHIEAIHSGDYGMFDEDENESVINSSSRLDYNLRASVDTLDGNQNLRGESRESFDSQTTYETIKRMILEKSKFVKKLLFNILWKISAKIRSNSKTPTKILNILKSERDFLKGKVDELLVEQ